MGGTVWCWSCPRVLPRFLHCRWRSRDQSGEWGCAGACRTPPCRRCLLGWPGLPQAPLHGHGPAAEEEEGGVGQPGPRTLTGSILTCGVPVGVPSASLGCCWGCSALPLPGAKLALVCRTVTGEGIQGVQAFSGIGRGQLYPRYFFDDRPRYGAPGVELTGLHKEMATVTQLHFLPGQVGGWPWVGLVAAPPTPHPPCCVSPPPRAGSSPSWMTTRCTSGRSARRTAAPTWKRPAASASQDAQGPIAISICLGGSLAASSSWGCS